MTFFGTVRFLLGVAFWVGLFQFIEHASRLAEATMLTAIFLYLTTQGDKR